MPKQYDVQRLSQGNPGLIRHRKGMVTCKEMISAATHTLLRVAITVTVGFLLAACATPSFIKGKPRPEPEPTRVAASLDLQVTPRELLTARLVNPAANEHTPRITVGKLVEFADRYLSCDCSGTRFVKSWTRQAGGYLMTTNFDLVRPLHFVCNREGETTNCYLSEIDRGSQVKDLEKWFVPGSEFIQFMYENGLKCDREGPCPADGAAD